jgi:NADH-quinone oxidoreductase subunit M
LVVPVAALGVFSILYGALAAMAQTDFKKLVAYSSVSHMGYVTLGMAVMNLAGDARYYAYGVNGAMFMMLAARHHLGRHVLPGRRHLRPGAHPRPAEARRPVQRDAGLRRRLVPDLLRLDGPAGLCGFVAEVFVILSSFHYDYTLGVLAAGAVVLTAGYILWTLQRVFLGRNEQYRGLPDLSVREAIIAAPLVLFTVLLGVFPQGLVFDWMAPSVDAVVRQVADAQTPGIARTQIGRASEVPALRVR